MEVSEHAVPWIQQQVGESGRFDLRSWLIDRFPLAADFVPSRAEIANHVGTAVKAIGAFLVTSASAFTTGTAGLLLDFFVMIYAMFYFLKDGRKILEKIFYYMPLSHEDEVTMLQRFASVTKATVKGTLLIGLIQGSLAGLAFFVAGLNGAAFWGTIMVILSIVPESAPPLYGCPPWDIYSSRASISQRFSSPYGAPGWSAPSTISCAPPSSARMPGCRICSSSWARWAGFSSSARSDSLSAPSFAACS